MTRYPGSQTRAMMHQKEELARELLRRGLTIRQVCLQLQCSPSFVRRIAQEQLATKQMEGTIPLDA